MDYQISNIEVEASPSASVYMCVFAQQASMQAVSPLSVCDVTIQSEFSRWDYEF